MSDMAKEGATRIRVHASGSPKTYRPAERADWETAPRWRRCHLKAASLIRQRFPELRSRRCHPPPYSSGRRHQRPAARRPHARACPRPWRLAKAARVVAIERGSEFILALEGRDGVGETSGRDLRERCRPLRGRRRRDAGRRAADHECVSAKDRLADPEGAIDRKMPFAIDLDGQIIDWTDEERATLREDAATGWLTKPMPGAIHCRPEGGEAGQWIKLGWAYNQTPSTLTDEPATDPNFPEIVLRGASRLQPRPQAIFRAASAADEPLWRLLYDDEGKLAARRPDEDKARLRRGRSFRLRDHGRRVRQARFAPPGCAARRVPPSPRNSALRVTMTRT